MENREFTETFFSLLEEKGLNRKQFAEKCGIPYTTVVGWTNLKRLSDYTALIKLADFFDCSIAYLVGREDDFRYKNYQNNCDEQETLLLENFRKLSKEDKAIILKISSKL